jgi:hypothetical protein
MVFPPRSTSVPLFYSLSLSKPDVKCIRSGVIAKMIFAVSSFFNTFSFN